MCDYATIAGALARYHFHDRISTKDQFAFIVMLIADEFQLTDENFDRRKFIEDVGYGIADLKREKGVA